MLKQDLQQKLLQKLSPLQIQTIKLVELPLMQLEQRIKKEIEENPVLEEESEIEENEDGKEESVEKEEKLSLDDYVNEENNIPSYRLSAGSSGYKDEDERRDYFAVSPKITLRQVLEEQLAFRYLDNKQHSLGLFLIGSMDDNGYLRRDLTSIADDIAFKLNVETTEEELEEILAVIQSFEPFGVGARDLRDCLLIQLRNRTRTEYSEVAEEILNHYFEEFTKKHYSKIISKMGIDDETMKNAINEIVKLNPKPGAAFDSMYSEQAGYIIPDFIFELKNGQPELNLNSYNMPELRLNRNYVNIMANYAAKQNDAPSKEKEAAMFVRQKIDSAKWFIEAIRQRRITLIDTMQSIIGFQQDYFSTGDESLLRPMILKDVAEKSGLDISTISRVVNSKYIQTEWGVFPLRHFFSEGIQADSGEEVSVREVKRIMMECIENEDKRNPLKDEEIVEILKEKGYSLARRTIAKYREKMNIPVGRLRKEL
ncbi:MAG: RNA polymerase factor sigma-54 [Prevotellaceae bacterium]|jgi:RNA polymerase sigma-54 factor|nr:RNA polymerase factor sigma-54 [Prevotellaceae bacterium]